MLSDGTEPPTGPLGSASSADGGDPAGAGGEGRVHHLPGSLRTLGHKYTLNCTQSATETQCCHLLTGSGTTARGYLSHLLETQLETNDFHQNTSQRYKNSFTFFILYNLNILLNISQLKGLSGLGSDWTSCDCSVTITHSMRSMLRRHVVQLYCS